MRPNNNRPFKKIDALLFIGCLCVMVLRCCYTENPHISILEMPGAGYESFYSLCISGVLIFLFILWAVSRLWARNFLYRSCWFEIGTVIFAIGAAVSCVFAANQRAAIVDSVTMLAPMLMAIVLVQVLDSSTRKKVLLIAIASAGIVNSYKCSEQFFVSNDLLIQEYKANPQAHLEKLGIESGSFQQMLYEHRLNSKDVRGYFTTGNSAGAFFVLGVFAALAVFWGWFNKIRSGKIPLAAILAAGIIVLILLAGLFETHSKGAIGAMIVALGGFLTWLACKKYLKKYKWALLGIGAIVVLTVTFLTVSYGVKHGKLPGGNSMLVRWQYWEGATKIISQHWLTGVGGGNFSTNYLHYKLPEALESVRDPHCFVLSILSQYGTVGLGGFAAAILLPFAVVLFGYKKQTVKPPPPENIIKTSTIAAIFGTLALLAFRPILLKLELKESIGVIIYALALLYVVPAILFWAGLRVWAKFETKIKTAGIEQAAIVLGLGAFLLHNLIDFAIFEPGILTAFWAMMACLVAVDNAKKQGCQRVVALPKNARFTILVLIAAIGVVFVREVLRPSQSIAAKTETSKKLVWAGTDAEAARLLDKAISHDRLNPKPAETKGKMLLSMFKSRPGSEKGLLVSAEKAFLVATKRDHANFKNYEKLADVYNILGELEPEKRTQWYEKSHRYLQQAITRYPASAKLRIKNGKILDLLGEKAGALEEYRQAVFIEDKYTRQFKTMYPGNKVFSRVGKTEYAFALNRIKALTEE